MVLLHELAHVKRLDCLWLLVGKVARAMHWYNPLVWWAVRQLRSEAERASDDRVLHAGEAAPDYAEQLIQIVAGLRNSSSTDVLALGMARPSTLETRVRSILSGSKARRVLSRGGAIGVVVSLAAVLIPLSMLKTAASAQAGPRKISILVVSPEGVPQPSVSIGDKLGGPPLATTDAAGRCEVTVVTSEPSLWYAHSNSSGKAALFAIQPGSIAQPLTVKLISSPCTWYGRVTDIQGHGVEGAQVVSRVARADGQFIESVSRTTDSAGYYEFGGMPRDDALFLQVGLSRNDVPIGLWTAAVNAAPHIPELYLVDLVDPRPGLLAPKPAWVSFGGLVQAEDGKPIAGAEVEASGKIPSDMGIRQRLAMTDAAGRWAVQFPPIAEITRLQVSHPQFVIDLGINHNPASSPERVRAGTAVTVLTRGVPLIGTVRDEKGSPVPNVLVLTQHSVLSIGMSGISQDPSMARSGKDGTFRLNVDPGQHELSTYSDDYVSTSLSVEIQAGMKPVEFVVQRGGAVTGVVVDGDGTPVAGANVMAGEGRSNQFRPSPRRRSVSDSSGHFKIETLPVDRAFTISATSPTAGAGNVTGAKVRPEPYRIALAARPNRVGGGNRIIALDAATGAPIKYYHVFDGPQFSPDGPAEFNQGLHYVVDSSDGTYIRRGGYTRPITGLAIRIIADGYLPAESPIVAGGESNEYILHLEAAPPIVGRLIDADGAPAAAAQVAWVSPGQQAFIDANAKISDNFLASPEVIAKTDAEGRFELVRGLAPGAIVAVHPKGYAQIESTSLKPGNPIRLIAWSRVEGQFKQGDATPRNVRMGIYPLDANARSRSAPINWMLSATTQSDGSFVFEHVPSIPQAVGLYELLGLAARVTIDPKPGQTETVHIGGTGRQVTGLLQLPADLGVDRVYSEFRPDRGQAFVTLRPASDLGDEPDKVFAQADPRRQFYSGKIIDGHQFTIYDVPSGQYVLNVRILAGPSAGRRAPRSPEIAHATVPVNVASDSGRLNLGNIAVKTLPKPAASPPTTYP
jgi:hypothetical protein